MCIDYELTETDCCAVRLISREAWITEKRPSIKAAAQEIRNGLAAQRKQSWPATTVIATVTESVAYPEHHADWWKKVYKKAGFTQMGDGLKTQTQVTSLPSSTSISLKTLKHDYS